MLFNNVNKNGKNPREKRSIKMARRRRCWAGVSRGVLSSIGGVSEDGDESTTDREMRTDACGCNRTVFCR